MKYSIPRILSILWVIFTISGNAQTPCRNFEIVESIPMESVLDNPDVRNAAEVWLEMIANAKSSIDIEQFYISNQAGEALEPVIRAIEQAADRGVQVRIIADDRMAKAYPETLERLNKRENIAVCRITVFNEMGGIQHSKYFIVDHEQVFLGSQNFDWRALDHIHEIGLRIQHSEYAGKMTKLFELDWGQCESNRLTELIPAGQKEWMTLTGADGDSIRFIATASPFGNVPSDFNDDLPAIIELIDNAKSRVFVQLLSYSPSVRNGYFGDLESALSRAAARGVDVRLLCSDWCQHKYEMPYLKKLVEKEQVNVKLSTIPEWSGAYISFARVEHCKMMISDNLFSWVGSSNWKRDYFHESRNIAVIVENSRVNEILSRIFLKSWDGPYTWRVDPDKDYPPKYYGEKD